MSLTSKLTRICAAVSLAVLVTGCTHSPNDPLEGYNRQAFYFNEAMDTVVVKPIAHGYHDLMPDVIQTMVSNFFGNIADVWIAFNNFLQGRGDEGFSDVSRIMINTFAGIGGLIDVASEAGLPKHNEDFGQTLGVWGAPPGPYFVIPILGPSTIRDTIAAPADYWFGDPLTYLGNSREGLMWGLVALRGISKRAELIDAASVIDDAAIDKYEFIRDAYLQRRQRQVHDKDLSDDQWETVNDKNKRIEGQTWLPSSEVKPQPSPVEKAADTTAGMEAAPEKASVQTTADTQETVVAPAAAAKAAPATDDSVADSAPEKDKPAQASGPASAETAALIN